MADVGDRDDQPEPFARLLAIHRVVEVPRRLAVDGDEVDPAQVLAACEVAFARRLRIFRGELLGGLGELERQVVLPERDLDLDTGIGGVPEDLHDPPDRLGATVGLGGQLGDHHLPGARAAGVLRRDVDVLADAPFRRLDEENPALAAQAPDDPRVDPLDHLDDLRLGAAAIVHARSANRDAVAVEHLAHLVRRQVQVLALVGDHETVSVGMAFHAPGDQVQLLRDQDRALAVAHDLGLALHRREAALERLALVARDRQALGELGVAQRHARLRKRLQNELAACYGIFVAGRLPFPVGIERAAVFFR